jgi:hypothetical protein
MTNRGLAVALSICVLGLGSPTFAAAPAGWSIAGNAPTDYEFSTDSGTAANGKSSAVIIARRGARSDGFGTLIQTITASDYLGARWRLSGYLRTEGAGRAQMWMRVDGPAGRVLSFDNMDSRPVTGTTAWRRYEIVADVPPESVSITFGFLLVATGKAWGDGFTFDRVDAKVPLTTMDATLPRQPANPDFEGVAATISAKWVKRRLSFLGDHLSECPHSIPKLLAPTLKQLGAGDDLVVKSLGCAPAVVGDMMSVKSPGLEAAFSSLEPADSRHAATAGSSTVAARWEQVVLKPEQNCRSREDRLMMRQLRQNIPAVFATRNLVPIKDCGFSVDVLRPG